MNYAAIYIGRVDRYGSRIVDKNGRECLEFSMYIPGQKVKDNGWREMYTVRVSAWGPPAEGDGSYPPIDKRPKKNDTVAVMGIPDNQGRANAVMCFTKNIAIGSSEIHNLLVVTGESFDLGSLDRLNGRNPQRSRHFRPSPHSLTTGKEDVGSGNWLASATVDTVRMGAI